MAIKWGGTWITAVKWGNTNLTQVKWGSTVVWPDSIGFNGSSYVYPIASGFNTTGGPSSGFNKIGELHYGLKMAASSNYQNYSDSYYIYFTSKDNINFSMYSYIDIDYSISTVLHSGVEGNSGSVHFRSTLDNVECGSTSISYSITTTVTAPPSTRTVGTIYRPRYIIKCNISSITSTTKLYITFYCEGGTLGGGSKNVLSNDNAVRCQVHSIKFYK